MHSYISYELHCYSLINQLTLSTIYVEKTLDCMNKCTFVTECKS